jgi:hypothetical protein
MACYAAYGPYVGNDFRIHPGGDAGQSMTTFPSFYADTLGRGHATFTGAQHFTVEDYEVWAVN